jgi:hypothetical protein
MAHLFQSIVTIFRCKQSLRPPSFCSRVPNYMAVGPGFPTEKNTENTMAFLRCVELYCFAEGSGHIFRLLRQYLGGRLFQDSE